MGWSGIIRLVRLTQLPLSIIENWAQQSPRGLPGNPGCVFLLRVRSALRQVRAQQQVWFSWHYRAEKDEQWQRGDVPPAITVIPSELHEAPAGPKLMLFQSGFSAAGTSSAMLGRAGLLSHLWCWRCLILSQITYQTINTLVEITFKDINVPVKPMLWSYWSHSSPARTRQLQTVLLLADSFSKAQHG